MLSYLLVRRISQIEWKTIDFQLSTLLFISIVFILMPLNYYLEWRKWKLALVAIQQLDDKSKAKNAFASGIVSSFLTPAFSGNFLGRVFFYAAEWRWKITVHSLVSNFSQFYVSLIFGFFSLLLLTSKKLVVGLNEYVILAGIGLFISSIIYFLGDKIAHQLPVFRIQSMAKIVESGPSRIQTLGLSFLRYLVFILQFVFALLAFGAEYDVQLLLWIGLVYLLVTLTPSLFFGKVVVRESIAVTVLAWAGYASGIVLFASFSIWLINLLLPTFLALFFVRLKR